MNKEGYITVGQLCRHYKIEQSFFLSLNEFGLLEINSVGQEYFVHEDKISDVERMIRMHYDLSINLEGIDTVLNLLDKLDELQQQLSSVRSRLQIYEGVD